MSDHTKAPKVLRGRKATPTTILKRKIETQQRVIEIYEKRIKQALEHLDYEELEGRSPGTADERLRQALTEVAEMRKGLG